MLVQGRPVMDVQGRKRVALEFLHMVVAGRIDEAYDAHVDPRGRHHNGAFPAGMPALRKAMKEAHLKMPLKQLEVRHVVGDDDLVAIHSRLVLQPGAAPMATVHLFRFEGDKVAEIWDFGQPAPADSPNKDGAF